VEAPAWRKSFARTSRPDVVKSSKRERDLLRLRQTSRWIKNVDGSKNEQNES